MNIRLATLSTLFCLAATLATCLPAYAQMIGQGEEEVAHAIKEETIANETGKEEVAPLIEEEEVAVQNLEAKEGYIKEVLAVKTNALAVPGANIELQKPLGGNWTAGAGFYYPWLWRKGHSQGVDVTGNCFEVLAADLELRYWFGRGKNGRAGRLAGAGKGIGNIGGNGLGSSAVIGRKNGAEGPGKSVSSKPRAKGKISGHSIGLYIVAGYYDLEARRSGLQGEFVGAGVDYLYSLPLRDGVVKLEFGLGLGCLFSPSRPYESFEQGGAAFRHPGLTKEFFYFGPSRAHLSLCVPLFSKGV